MKFGIIISRFNESITDTLLKQCLKGFEEQGITPTVVHVPGAAEIPLAAQALIQKEKLDAIVALGCVIKGETEHYENICNLCTEGINQVSLKFNIPIIFEVIMTDSYQKAEARTDKAYYAAFTATEMANLVHNKLK